MSQLIRLIIRIRNLGTLRQMLIVINDDSTVLLVVSLLREEIISLVHFICIFWQIDVGLAFCFG